VYNQYKEIKGKWAQEVEHLFKYHGTVSSIGFSSKGCSAADLILGDITDWDMPPVRVEAHGALAKYINEIEMTDAEERYIQSDWYYDSNLFLYRIEVPSSHGHSPAKVITQADFLSSELVIFGPKDYIETDSPEPMTREQYNAWIDWKVNH